MSKFQCRICDDNDLKLMKLSNLSNLPKSSDFAISDFNYGKTLSLYKCQKCDLLQAPTSNVLNFYKHLVDPEYEKERDQRYLQAKYLLSIYNLKDKPPISKKKIKLLDIGAGSGILIEASKELGFDVKGIEPSKWLSELGRKRGLNIFTGTLSEIKFKKKFDFITLIDVIEHVTNPSNLLKEAYNNLKPGGIVYIVTPNLSSFMAKLLGYKWWHFRVAHITYFNEENLKIIAEKNGFLIKRIQTAGWFFSYSYLRIRLLKYFPSWILPPNRGFISRITFNFNLYDSILLVCKKPTKK